MKLDKSSLRLYAVTDRSWVSENKGEDLYFQVEQALKGGATFIQLREKNLIYEDFRVEALRIQELCRNYKVPFVIDDNVILAKEIIADGVHVGQSDMELLEAREMLGKDAIIGVSVQNVEQALKAEKNGADYLGVGAVFPTTSKSDAQDVSLVTLKEICRRVKIPVVAIGGISEKNVNLLKGTGICGIAVISAIFAQKNIQRAAENLSLLISEYL